MLDFHELVTAIHVSVQRASVALSEENYRAFRRYFIDNEGSSDLREILRDAARAVSETAEAESTEAESAEDKLRRVADSLRRATDALDREPDAWQPRTFSIDYPTVTKDGPKVHTVHIPLISIAPHMGTKVSKLVFRADLDLHIDDDNCLKVGMSSSGGKTPPPARESAPDEAPPSDRSRATIEITVESTSTPDGLRKVIEGYDRALRAQIPG